MNSRRNSIIGIALGIGAALAYGTTSVLIRQGVAGLAPPLVGAAVSLFAGTLALTAIGVRGLGANIVQNRRAVGLLLIAGVFAGLGVVSNFFALSMAPVVIVSPVEAISPLFALLWSYLFLGQLERITLRIVLGSAIVVFGVVLIALGRAA
ncbi:MAG: family transporter [Dehalococcoidales bacterium]|nr:family transporter [Dehalococcoidales bacterium]